MSMRVSARLGALVLVSLVSGTAMALDRPHNVVLFVPDGLRGEIVSSDTAPAMAALRQRGVRFANTHSLFPTFTTANASAMATGHYLGDTGDFSNTIYAGFPVPGAGDSLVPFLESDPVLGDVDEHFGGDYLDEVTILRAARDAGLSTAAVGKLGPTLIFDHTERTGQKTVVLDDQTGSGKGIPVADWVAEGLKTAGLDIKAPARGDNGKAGDFKTPGTLTADAVQGDWFAAATTKVLLPAFKKADKPFVLVFWSRDPDGTQHNQGDSLLRLVPGINGPTSMAGIRNADNDLARILQALGDLGLADTTDVIVTSDHGFSTISKESATSSAAKAGYADTPPGLLPLGFVGIDLAKALDMPLWDPDAKNARIAEGTHPKFGNAVIGADPMRPDVVVAVNGGSDLIYFPGADAKALAAKVIPALMAQDYTSGLFVDPALGAFPGTMTLKDINLQGSAVTPMPAIALNFRSWTSGCDVPSTCTVEVADTVLQQGQGMHGSFGRGDTMNFQAAAGPDFRAGFTDVAPTSNADIGKTIAAILRLDIPNHGVLVGRVLTEAMPGGLTPSFTSETLTAPPDANGLRTILRRQRVGTTDYFDAAGFAGRTYGLE